MSILTNSPSKRIAFSAVLLLAGACAAWAAAAGGATNSAESIFNSPNATAAPPAAGAVSAGAAGDPAASPAAASVVAASADPLSSFSDNFSSDTTNACLADGSTFGPWASAFSGYGCNQVETAGDLFWLDESPMISTAPSLTHSAMILGPAFSVPISFSVSVYTNAQLRKNGPPNPWEVGWLVWDYADIDHFYSFIPKPNGWELIKKDPAYPGSRRKLASGSSPVFPIDAWYSVKIVQAQNVITVYVNGQLIATFADTENPYAAGNIALYDEDANVRFENVAVNIAPAAIGAVSAYGVGQTSATVAWTTGGAADAQVEYGPTTDYASTTTSNGVMTTTHSVVLNGLASGTLYHYAAVSRNIAGEPTASADFTFTTSSAAVASPATVAAAALTIMTAPFLDNFSSGTPHACFPDGTPFGAWAAAFSGSGCTQIENAGALDWLNEAPAISTAPSLAHSALVLGPAFSAPLTFSGSLDTAAQLRSGTPPNPWEVGSLVWDYTDGGHYYAFVPQPNGWALNKEDPSYPGSLRLLATGASPVFPTGSWRIVKIVQVQNVITVYVNGQLITTFTDAQTPYLSGSIGLLAQDSQVGFADIAVNVPPSAAPTVSVSVPASVAASAAATGTTTLLARTSNDAGTALVQFLLDGAPLGPAVNIPPFSLAWNTTLVASGAHSLGAMIWDAAGDSSIAPLVPVVVSNSAAATAAAGAVDPDRAPQKFLSPALADGINDVATFGANATEVSVYNVRGRLVFHAARQGNSPIVWNCKDGMGRVDESGVYIAKIKTTDSGVLYQSFALVK